MKKLLLIVLLLCATCTLKAQVVIDIDNISSMRRNVTLKMTIQDSSTEEPVSFATVYLIPQNDTTITNFAVAGVDGTVEMKDVISGKYQVNVEIIGYKPYNKVHNLTKWEENLGIIKLEENPEYIDAATVSAVGNAISVQGDTLTYNASSFRVMENAMLEDLLKKMPGMEVSSDGTVKVNGETVDKITVGGRTFFFNDPAMALKNLPAKIVDKIKVIDKKKDEAEFSGVSTRDEKEKVMDVELKEDYKKGWFGNVKLGGGAAISKKDESGLTDGSKALFNSSAMAAGYNELDQVTLMANGKNASEPGGSRLFIFSGSDDIDEFAMKNGLTTSAQGGVNYNTERIRGMETNSSVSYSFTDKDAREKSARTSFQADGKDIRKDASYQGLGTDHKINGNFEIRKKKSERFLFSINPTLSYTIKDRKESSGSTTNRDEEKLNSSATKNISKTNVFNTRTTWNSGINNIGKKGRNLTFNGNFTYRDKSGSSSEYSETRFENSSDIRDLVFDNKTNYLATEGIFSYVEPIGEKWALQTRFTACYITQKDDKAAFNGNDGSTNKYYSSYSMNKDLLFRERVLAQYEKGKTKGVFGIQIDQENNPVISRSMGEERTVGEGVWILNFAPYADFEWSSGNNSLDLSAGGRTESPMGEEIIPALNISNPVQTSMGNIYLIPSFSQNYYFRYSRNNPKKNTYFYIGGMGYITSKNIVDATWFDGDGVRYAIPVNSKKAGSQFSGYLNYRFPLNKDKTLTLNLHPYFNYSSNITYQAKKELPGLDKDHFDYTATMSQLWGNADGDLFYSGKSGFAESRRKAIEYSLEMEMEYQIGEFDLTANGYAVNNISKYSFDKKANNNIWEFNIGADFLWEGGKGWSVNTDIAYNFYRGYSDGYGKPEFIWNARISRQIKAVTFNLSVSDILNQEKSLYRNTSAEYMEDTYHNVLGRYFLFSITFNFGKMNAGNNSKAQSAMWKMY